MYAPTPHDVFSRYLDIYGLEGVFPVARTEIGNLAAIASEEILYPEIARSLGVTRSAVSATMGRLREKTIAVFGESAS